MRRFTLLTVLVFCLITYALFSDAYYPEIPPKSETAPAPPPEIILYMLEGETELVQKLIAHDSRVLEVEDDAGRTPLHYAAHLGSEEFAELLLRNGADPTRTDHAGSLPMHIAVSHGYAFARTFSNHGRLLYTSDAQGVSAFSSAASEGPLALLTLLGRNYLDIPDYAGNTPLHHGALLGDTAIVSRLIAEGAHVNNRNREGSLPLDIALSFGESKEHAEAAVLLVSAYSDRPGKEEFIYAYRSILSGDLTMRFDNQASVLHVASSRNHLALLRVFLDEHVSPQLRDLDGNTPLHTAAASGHGTAVSLLVERGSDVHAVNTLSQTPLHIASLQSSLEIAALLIEAHAPAEAADWTGNTPLHLAARRSADMTALLLEMGADANQQNSDGNTPLMTAIESRNEPAVRLLLAYGADMHMHNFNQVTPLQRALLAGAVPTSWLVNPDTWMASDAHGNTALHIAVQVGSSSDVLEYCLKTGADTEAANRYGNTPLHDAMTASSLTAAAYLMNQGADLFAVNHMGKTPIDILFSRGTEDIRSLLDPALVNRTDAQGNTLLHVASRSSLPDAASLLLSLGADPDVINREGYAPVHYAARLDSIPLLQTLTQHNANLNLPAEKNGSTAVHEAVAYGSSRALRFLLLAGARVHSINSAGYSPVHTAVLHQDDISIRALHEFGASLEQRDPSGLTPLHIAVRKQDYTMASLLIRFGSNVLTRDNMGSTALHDCIKGRNGDIGGMLTAAGADIHATNRFNESPLTLAFNAGVETVQWLLTGPAASSRDNAGNTPLHLAVKHQASMEVLHAVLEASTDVDSRNNRLETPLHAALHYRYYKAALFLVHAGADIFAHNGEQEFPLAYALMEGPEALRWIITEDTINAVDSQGSTPLHAAVEFGSPETVLFLLEAGADQTLRNHAGMTPEETARTHGRDEIVDLF